jgi:hypothetical protein
MRLTVVSVAFAVAGSEGQRFLQAPENGSYSDFNSTPESNTTTLSPEGEYWKSFGEQMRDYWQKYGEHESATDNSSQAEQSNATRRAWQQFGEKQGQAWARSDAVTPSESGNNSASMPPQEQFWHDFGHSIQDFWKPKNLTGAVDNVTASETPVMAMTVIDGIKIDDIDDDDSSDNDYGNSSASPPSNAYWKGFGQGSGSYWQSFNDTGAQSSDTLAQYSNATAWQQYGQKLGKSWSEFGEKATPAQIQNATTNQWKQFGEGVANQWEGKHLNQPGSLLTIDGIQIDDIDTGDSSSSDSSSSPWVGSGGGATTLSPEASFWKSYGKDIAGYWREFGQSQNETFGQQDTNATQAAWKAYGERLGAQWSNFGQSEATQFLSNDQMAAKFREMDDDFQQSVSRAINAASLIGKPDEAHSADARLADAVQQFWKTFSSAEDQYWKKWNGVTSQFWGTPTSV